jgi:integrase
MAEIIPRGKNKWLVRISVERNAANGKRKRHSKLINGQKKDAERYARETETKRDLGTLDKPAIEDPTLDKFLDSWLTAFKKHTVKERTLAGYEYILNQYVRPYLGKDRLSELTMLRIQEFYNQLSENGLSPRTVSFSHSLIRDALNQAVIGHLIDYNPTLSTRRPPRKKKAIDVFTPEEAERFMKAAKTNPRGIIFWFALAVGARPEEYLGLQWPDLNLDKKEVNITKSIWWPKGGGWKLEEVKTQSSLRTINFNATIASALKAHKASQAETRLRLGKKYHNNNFVFATRIGTPLGFRDLVLRHLQPIMERAKIDGPVNLYRLRHSFVTLSILSGADLKSVSRAAGHSSVAFTMDTYQHVLPSMRKDAAEKVGALLFGRR